MPPNEQPRSDHRPIAPLLGSGSFFLIFAARGQLFFCPAGSSKGASKLASFEHDMLRISNKENCVLRILFICFEYSKNTIHTGFQHPCAENELTLVSSPCRQPLQAVGKAARVASAARPKGTPAREAKVTGFAVHFSHASPPGGTSHLMHHGVLFCPQCARKSAVYPCKSRCLGGFYVCTICTQPLKCVTTRPFLSVRILWGKHGRHAYQHAYDSL